MTDIKLNDKKTIRAWALFDWANSAYALVISTAIFPPFFTGITDEYISVFGTDVKNTAIYSFSISLSYFFLIFINPILAGMADSGGKRMFFLKIFTFLGALACMSLFMFKTSDFVWWGTFLFMMATICFTASTVFYNAYLPDIVTEDQYDRISAKGYAYGYVGSVILLLFILFMIQSPETFGMEASSLQARIGFLLVGVWWLGFAQYSFINLPKDKEVAKEKFSVRDGFKQLSKAFNLITKDKYLFRFIMAFFFYIGGVNTIIYLATVFAQDVIGFNQSELIITVLIIQLVAIAGAYLFAFISDTKGNKFSLASMLVIWIAICVLGFFVEGKTVFYALAGFVGMVMGGIQSLSRSTYSKLIDDHKEELNSFFSLYDVTKNIAIVAGTMVFGLVVQWTGDMRYSILSVAVFFFLGLVFLLSTNLSKTDQAS